MSIIFIIVGALVVVAALYYLVKEGADQDSRKTYGIMAAVGAAAVVFGVLVQVGIL